MPLNLKDIMCVKSVQPRRKQIVTLDGIQQELEMWTPLDFLKYNGERNPNWLGPCDNEIAHGFAMKLEQYVRFRNSMYYDKNGCLVSVKRICYNGKRYYSTFSWIPQYMRYSCHITTHRLALCFKLGYILPDNIVAAHDCVYLNTLCCSHLSPKTYSENSMDRIRDGTMWDWQKKGLPNPDPTKYVIPDDIYDTYLN